MEKDTDRIKDTEGHVMRGRYAPSSEDETDAEGHGFKRGAADSEDETDAEGHGFKRGAADSEDDRDAEGNG